MQLSLAHSDEHADAEDLSLNVYVKLLEGLRTKDQSMRVQAGEEAVGGCVAHLVEGFVFVVVVFL